MINIPKFRDISQASKQVATKSAMNPILWKTAICFPVGVVCCLFAKPPLNYIILALSALPVVVGSLGYIFFALKNADRLQSEQHIENLHMLAKIGRDDPDNPILLQSQGSETNGPRLEGK